MSVDTNQPGTTLEHWLCDTTCSQVAHLLRELDPREDLGEVTSKKLTALNNALRASRHEIRRLTPVVLGVGALA